MGLLCKFPGEYEVALERLKVSFLWLGIKWRKVDEGNIALKCSLKLVRLALRYHLACVAENPWIDIAREQTCDGQTCGRCTVHPI